MTNTHPVTLTVLSKKGGPLTKKISLAADGTLVKDGSACVMSCGSASRVKVADVAGLGALIESLKPSQALALGTLRHGLPDTVEVITKAQLNGATRTDIIARTSANIIYDGPAFALLDYDSKAMPATVAAELKCAGGFWPALLSVLPALGNAARVMRNSTSSGLSRTDTGEQLPGSDGVHVYIRMKDGADSERFLRALHDRCWLAGLGWLMVGVGGTRLERSIVDRMVGGPERLVFEGGPVLVPPLVQDKTTRCPIATDGATLDTAAACPELSIVQQAQLKELKARECERLAPELAKARSAFIAAKIKEHVARSGVAEKVARQVIARQCDGILLPDIVLPFDDPALAGKTVGDVLADPDLYEGATLADPLEGLAYGRCVAKIMRRADGMPWIHSFAHGRTIYELKLDATTIRKAMEAAAKEDVVAIFATGAANAELDAFELSELRRLAKKLSGVAMPAIDAALKSAQQQKVISAAKIKRTYQAANRRDLRPCLRAPFSKDPWLPQMDVLNEVIVSVAKDLPPSRDVDDDAAQVRKRQIPGTHAFINANPEGDDE